jgi:uncharacterized protein YbjT (DUF2867 family)
MEAGQEIAVHPDAPSVFQPIHSDDMVAMVPRLLEIAAVPATTVNWGGDEKVSVEEWTAMLTDLTGIPAKVVHTEQSLQSVELNLDRMHELVGHAQVKFADGLRRMIEAQRPDLLKPR